METVTTTRRTMLHARNALVWAGTDAARRYADCLDDDDAVELVTDDDPHA